MINLLKNSFLINLDEMDIKKNTINTCILDSDCRLSSIPDFNSLYCVHGLCIKLKGSGFPCNFPEECASYDYYGPLACSMQCKNDSLSCKMNQNNIKNTRFCCKGIPLYGECNSNRPGYLSGCNQNQVCTFIDGANKCVNKKEKLWILAMICSITGNIVITVGINYQKLSYKQNYLNISPNKIFISTMLFGVIIYILGKIISFSAYIFGNQSLMAGLSAIGLIANSFCAPLINNEIITWKDIVAIILVIIGSTILVLNSATSHNIYTLCELIKMYYKTETLVWFMFLIILIISFFLFVKFVEVNSDWNFYNDPFNNILKIEGLFIDEDSFICKYIMLFAYIGLSSFIASFTTLCVKSLGEILLKAINGDKGMLYNKSGFLFMFGVILCTFLQIYWLNRALKHYDALIVCPLFHGMWTLLSIGTAGIYFQDFEHFSVKQIQNFIFSVIIIFIGSFFLAMRITNKKMIKIKKIVIPEEEIIHK